VWLAADGRAALDLYRQHRQAITTVLLDVCMPGLDGPRTLLALREIDPGIRPCFMSGGVDQDVDWDLLQLDTLGMFWKPFPIQDVLDFLRQVTGPDERGPRACPEDGQLAWASGAEKEA
jgi:DNA-binding NtrC family response regulator